MKALLITPKDDTEYKFIFELLKKLGVRASALKLEDVEDIGLAQLMKGVDKTKKASRMEIMEKLSGNES